MFMHTDTRVKELINLENASWKEEVLNTLFLPHKAEVIKSIPLSVCPPSNKQIWAYSYNGKFSVRSAYAVAMELSSSQEKCSSLDESRNRRF